MEVLNQKDFQEGFSRGVENSNAEPVEQKLTAFSTFQWLQANLTETKSSLIALEEKINSITEKHRSKYGELQKFTQQLNQKMGEKASVESTISVYKEEISELNDRKKEHKTPYSLLAGVLYFLAGFAFLAGDLIISHEIVAYALNIRNTVEAWAFAVGLASLSILLKPAYERLVEQPYLKAENLSAKKIYGYFQSGLLVLSVLTLVILGWFRYEAYKTDKLKEGINRQIKTMQMQATSIDPSEVVDNTQLLADIDTKLAEYNALNVSLVNSPLAMLSFILTGLLFAIAGAICLGIAFPILQVFWLKGMQLNPGIKRRKRRIRKILKTLDPINEQIAKLSAARDVFTQEINYLDDLESLRNERKVKLAEIEKLKTDILDLGNNVIASNVRDGYQKGSSYRNEMTDEEYESYRRKESSATGSSAPKRPHLALRKAIAEQL